VTGGRDWENEDPTTQVGRHVNELNRKVSFARKEVNRIVEIEKGLAQLKPALMNETAEIEDELKQVRKLIYKLPELAKFGILFTKRPKSSDDEVDEWLDDLFKVLKAFLDIDDIERRIIGFSELVPLALQTYLRQRNDTHLSKYLRVIEVLVKDMLDRFGLSDSVFTVLGTQFKMIHLRGVAEDSSILMIPISQYTNILGWVPIGHEVGHILYRSKYFDRDEILQQVITVMQEHTSILNPSISVTVLKWFEETFADCIMAEMFIFGAVIQMDTILSRERVWEFLNDIIETISEDIDKDVETGFYPSHPPRRLRLKLMLDFIDRRTESLDIDSFRKHLRLDRIDFERDYGVPIPWDNKAFQNSVMDLIVESLDKTDSKIDISRFAKSLLDVRDGSSLSGYTVLEIVSAITHYYAQQHDSNLGEIGNRPETTLEYLLQRIKSIKK
jgi:hypothetical protein